MDDVDGDDMNSLHEPNQQGLQDGDEVFDDNIDARSDVSHGSRSSRGSISREESENRLQQIKVRRHFVINNSIIAFLRGEKKMTWKNYACMIIRLGRMTFFLWNSTCMIRLGQLCCDFVGNCWWSDAVVEISDLTFKLTRHDQTRPLTWPGIIRLGGWNIRFDF